MKLLVGLGNPGARYRDTRHNVGFLVADELARRHQGLFESAPADAVMARLRTLGGGALVVKPLTMMNLSGDAVQPLAHYFRIAFGDILVIADDVNLPFGRLRARPRGSAGGHNGFRSIIERLGTEEFPRLRIGVGRGDARRDLADHVLARFEPDELAELPAVVARAADAAETFVTGGIEDVMSRFNRSEAATVEAEDDT